MEFEEWLPVDGFPNYKVSSQGRIINLARDHIMSYRQNREGICMVNLTDDDGVVQTRSAALIVATSFVDPLNHYCDTVIHLDGDKTNLNSENLEWRPRWFARKYHQQFNQPEQSVGTNIYCVDTDMYYPTVRAAAVAYGVLEEDILKSCINQGSVWPHAFDFRIEK